MSSKLSTLLSSQVSTYETVLPISKQSVKYRPFTVKEEKILLIALESDNENEVAMAIEKIITNCTDGTVEPSTLALADVEALFLALRAKSVANRCEPILTYTDESGKVHHIQLTVDIDTIEITTDPDHTNEIRLTDTVAILMRYPTLRNTNQINPNQKDTEMMFDMIANCIDEIHDDTGNVWKADEISKEEIHAFIESMNEEQFSKILDFFKTMPQLVKEVEFEVNGKKETVTLRGLQDFFGSPSVTSQ